MYPLFNYMEVLTIANIKSNDLPINEKIRVKQLMVIGPNGEQMGMKDIDDALTLANYAGLDLVLMSENSQHPVGKIMDYNKYNYERKKKQKEALKNQRASRREIKEYQLSVNIDIGDFNTRVRNAESYLKKGHKIKATIKFKGRQMAHTELGRDVLIKFSEELKECSTIESNPKLTGRDMAMILAPIK